MLNAGEGGGNFEVEHLGSRKRPLEGKLLKYVKIDERRLRRSVIVVG